MDLFFHQKKHNLYSNGLFSLLNDKIIFQGGGALHFVYSSPRYSSDVDFVDPSITDDIQDYRNELLNIGSKYNLNTAVIMKNQKGMWPGTELVNFRPRPGTLIIFPGYMEHEYAVDHGKAPFRFIHWNITAIPKEMAKDG